MDKLRLFSLQRSSIDLKTPELIYLVILSLYSYQAHHQQYDNLPEVTLSASGKIGHAEPSIPVLMQWMYKRQYLICQDNDLCGDPSQQEWKIDIATIGWVYVKADRVAWTLQETPISPIIVEKTCNDSVINERSMTKDMQWRLYDQLEPLWQVQLLLSLASEMERLLGTGM
ncbi:hypothetical protein IW262DRAFT_1296047 [Armillaria fumosa]|nr:hypothetical protein IW262DRAFT_1296047 [Armillaria fumosa]